MQHEEDQTTRSIGGGYVVRHVSGPQYALGGTGGGGTTGTQQVTPGGANRVPIERDYSQISDAAIDLMAETQHEGNVKYGRGNWQKGIPISNLLSHGLNHIIKFMNGDTSEGTGIMAHLGHALWNFEKTAHFIKYRPDLIDVDAIKKALLKYPPTPPPPLPVEPNPDRNTVCWFCVQPVHDNCKVISGRYKQAHGNCYIRACMNGDPGGLDAVEKFHAPDMPPTCR